MIKIQPIFFVIPESFPFDVVRWLCSSFILSAILMKLSIPQTLTRELSDG